jgi:glycosyltransferase involved in cell wall biosynthesis
VVVLMAARHEYPKGADVLLQALPTVLHAFPRARLLIAGREGRLTPALRAGVRRLGLEENVELLGPRSDVPDLMCAADVFVLPSRWEGLGGVLLEAMALEAPIVASDIGPIREVLGNGETGVLVPPGDPSALARGLLSVITDSQRASGRARQARSRFMAEFTIDSIADRMVAFYERALVRSHGPRGRAPQANGGFLRGRDRGPNQEG